ncbi:hypothetical protein [Caproiciproducens sp. LBM24188]|nr:hypothetical protein [Oscillospiraceae bacterium]
MGVDLPAGTYKITAHKGTGTFATSDNSVNAKLSKVADATHQQVIKNVAIHDGTTVSVTGVTVKIVCKEKVDLSKLKERTNTATKTYKLKPGSYTVGNDMEAGTYDLYTEDGSGTVATTDGKFSISVGSDTSDANQRRFKNVTFQKGQTLKITGATMKFSPSD